MLSVTTMGTTDGDAVLFIQAHDRPVSVALKELPAWIWSCEDARVEVFVQWNDRVLQCPITQLLKLVND
ncbi:hypothetical protein OsccyDRAFT_4896 [Leptolyngbyaceae cyanobacterium JSC-12]|nr:hypothetical protein OsccyDRAFT_4896 [Leptolyngbyaceae cyanobacterium JSC-12]